jgi:hypothetical protein
MAMSRPEWTELIHSYIAEALHRAHIAKTESAARYWRDIAQRLNQELPHSTALRFT